MINKNIIFLYIIQILYNKFSNYYYYYFILKYYVYNKKYYFSHIYIVLFVKSIESIDISDETFFFLI